MYFSFSEIVLLLGAGQGILLSVAFIFSRRGNPAGRYLFAFILLVVSWQLFLFALNYSGNLVKVPHLALTAYPFMFLIGPCYYLYMRSLISQRLQLTWWDPFHIIPFLVIVFLFKDFYVLPAATKAYVIQSWGNSTQLSTAAWLYTLGNMLVNGSYFFLAFRLVYLKEKSMYDYTSDNKKMLQVSHLKTATAGYSVYLAAFTITVVLLFLFEYYSQEIDYAWILTKSIFIYVIGYMAVNQPESLLATSLKGQASAEKASKYKKSGLSEEQANYYYQKLQRIMQEKQPYLNNELDREMLAEQLSITPNLLSQIINQKTRQNFYGLINQFRIQHAQRLLQQQPNSSSKKTVLEIAMESGFNSKSSFYRNFKKYTGQTPASYRQTVVGEH